MLRNASAVAGRRILVTGGAGFIGSELVRQLRELEADQIRVVDNLTNGKRSNLEDVEGPIELFVVDIRDGEALREALENIDIVFHLACLGVRHSLHSPLENHDVNATGTLTVLSEAHDARVQRFVYVSTSEVYGTARTVPMSEAHPTNPHTIYGASKLAGEHYTLAFGITHEMPVVVVRPFNAYGPRSHHEGDSGEVIPRFCVRALAEEPLVVFGDGTQTRDFTHVSDSARGIIAAGVAEGVIGSTFNIGSGVEVSINELASLVESVTGKEVGIERAAPRPGDVRRLVSDSSLARHELGFEPQIGMREGVAALVEWYLASGVDPRELLREEVLYSWVVA